MTRQHGRFVGSKSNATGTSRRVYIEAACDSTDPIRSLGRLVGTKANATGVTRNVYVKAECTVTGLTTTGRALGKRAGTKTNATGISRAVYTRTCCGVSTVCCPGVVLPSTLFLTVENIDFPGFCFDGTVTPITFVPGSLPSAIWKSPLVVAPNSCAPLTTQYETFRLKCFATPSGVFGMSFPFPPDPTESSGYFSTGTLWRGATVTCSPFSFSQGVTSNSGERYLFTVTA